MFSLTSQQMAKLAPALKRVLIVDANAAAAKLLTDVVRSLGARDVVTEADQVVALRIAADFDPTLIFIERSGPNLDGETFARRIRRSTFEARFAPIVMVTSEATASTIKGARDAGVHEFLRKPFTAGDLTKRVAAVALKPRDWIEALGYVGPDRRRFNSAEYEGPKKRSGEAPCTAAEAAANAREQAMQILASAIARFDEDPAQALRAIRAQATDLKALALKQSDAALAVEASTLEAAMAHGANTRAALAGPVQAVLALAGPESLKRAG
ncbi:response regulator [Brevundimonas lutea]|nr:response regulator [Brevundimonas lutea]